ncbi:MAG: potassium/proton antiporter [Desulfovibrionaceae bacterium]|jgi:potassium/hydrogen antiporter|nr:potassium/proton antiporter [Desulfovibrionaceae bacterium]
MNHLILIVALIIVLCTFLNKVSNKIGIPVLLLFIVVGILSGSDGLLKIEFEDYVLSEKICSIALIFIMFYGGFGTRWDQAKNVSYKAGILSTLGVLCTAGLTALFCYTILHFGLGESFLMGAVISSTDAASVFSILRSQKLGLKNNTDSLLELESGSNDPCSYLLTILALAFLDGNFDSLFMIKMLGSQFVIGILFGIAIAYIAVFVLSRYNFSHNGSDMAFVIGVALLSYACAAILDGNGYLSVYLCGIIMGNKPICNKKALVHFANGITGLMQILIFFLLGLLATPSKIPDIFLPAFAIMLFLTFIARPTAIFLLMLPFKSGLRENLLISFAGLRGAASIVFAIMAVVHPSQFSSDLFHIVFCIVLLSIAFQGALLAPCARMLKMTDSSINIMKTFSDYTEDIDLSFIKIIVNTGHIWTNKKIKDIIFPPETLVAMIIRDNKRIIPHGDTTIFESDIVILTAKKYEGDETLSFKEYTIKHDSALIGKRIYEFSQIKNELVIILIRKSQTIVPNGNTIIEKNDKLVIAIQ